MPHYPIENYIVKRLQKRALGPGIVKMINPLLPMAKQLAQDIRDFIENSYQFSYAGPPREWEGYHVTTHDILENLKSVWHDVMTSDEFDINNLKQTVKNKEDLAYNLKFESEIIWPINMVEQETTRTAQWIARNSDPNDEAKIFANLGKIVFRIREFRDLVYELLGKVYDQIFAQDSADYWSVD